MSIIRSAVHGIRSRLGAQPLSGTATGAVYVLGVLSAVKAVGLVLLAEVLARGIVLVISSPAGGAQAQLPLLVGVGAAAVVLRSGASWATTTVGTRAALREKERVRRDLSGRVLQGGAGGIGELTTLATRGLDDLDRYFTQVLPAVTSAAVVPLVLGARILFADGISAIVIAVTIPLVPVFLALIGMQTRDRVEEASASLTRLSEHLVELARGLPVLVGLGRVDEQTDALNAISTDYRRRTMVTLRTAFLSSLALELIATISVAIVAVFIGFRLVDGTLPLEVGLLVLVLAPECYLPFRELGAAFHASSDGRAALERAKAVIAGAESESLEFADHPASAITVSGLTVVHRGRRPVIVDLDVTIPATGVTAVSGPSGSGKSTLLEAVAGVLVPSADCAVEGRIAGVDRARIAWVPQHPRSVESTTLDELILWGATPDRAFGLLEEFGLHHLAQVDPEQLSPGELRRLAIARAIVRVDGGAQLVVLDEPTAHLDSASATRVERAIAQLGRRVPVLLASHEPSTLHLADHHLVLGGGGSPEVRSGTDDGMPVSHDHRRPAHPSASPEGELSRASADTTPGTPAAPLLPLVAALLGPSWKRLMLAVLLGSLATLFAVSLTAVSGWLIVRASQQPAIMYLLVAIVGVRFFGIGRSVLRYAERLATHDAVFASVTALRVRLWRGLAARGAGSRSLFTGGTALDFLVSTADEVRDLAPRVLLPPIIGLVTGVTTLVAVGLLAPAAIWMMAGCLGVGLLLAPTIALLADRRASVARGAVAAVTTRRFASVVAAADELRVNGLSGSIVERLAHLDRRAGDATRRTAGALGLGSALALVAALGGSLGMLVVCAPLVARGDLAPEILAVLVLVPLGLVDPMLTVVDTVQQWPAFLTAMRKVAAFAPRDAAASASAGSAAPSSAGASASASAGASADAGIDGGTHSGPLRVSGIRLDELSARWSGMRVDAIAGVTARVALGEWMIVTGPSGSGKSTLLSVLLGSLPPTSGRYRFETTVGGTVDAALASSGGDLTRHVAWCPQEGHLFDSTLRGNLLIARPRDDAPTDRQMIDAIESAGLGPLFSSLPLGLETRIGSAGDELSGGERQRLAVARTLLSRAEVVLLDEPTAHLDVDTAQTLMHDLRHALRDRIVVLVTHHAEDVRDGDLRLDLGGLASDGLAPRSSLEPLRR